MLIRHHRLRARPAVAVVALSLTAGLPHAAGAQTLPPANLAYGATADQRLLRFSLDAPLATTSRPITGLAGGERVVGIDERPKTGALYAVVRRADGSGRAYTLNPATGAATPAFDLRNAAGGAPIGLSGNEFGVDFNPMADALRIVSDTGQNLRALPSDRVTQPGSVSRLAGDTFVDGTLSYAATGTSPRPAATGVASAAYTNNVAGAASTTLLDIDGSLRDLVLQAPPNEGTLARRADLDLGVRRVGGFDIKTTGATDEAYAVLGGVRFSPAFEELLFARRIVPSSLPARLFRVNLITGALTPAGLIGTGSPLVGFAVDLPSPI